MEEYLPILLLTTLAGLSTLIGGMLAFTAKSDDKRFLSLSMGFSAGVMIYISFMELLPEAVYNLEAAMPGQEVNWIMLLGFFGGMGITALIDKFIPSYENPHEIKKGDDLKDAISFHRSKPLLRTGMLATLAIAIHNFPEGIATFFSGLNDTQLGISIAVAIAIHNIPEGVAIATPIYQATKSKKQAFYYTAVAGLAEPIGAIIGLLLLKDIFNGFAFGILYAVIAGIMVFISFDQLLPAMEKYGRHHLATYSLVAGMAVMALSLLMIG